jgi:hypothetical protein
MTVEIKVSKSAFVRKRKVTSTNTEFDIQCQNKQQKLENDRASLFIKFVEVFQNILHELYTIIS